MFEYHFTYPVTNKRGVRKIRDGWYHVYGIVQQPASATACSSDLYEHGTMMSHVGPPVSQGKLTFTLTRVLEARPLNKTELTTLGMIPDKPLVRMVECPNPVLEGYKVISVDGDATLEQLYKKVDAELVKEFDT